MPTEMIRTRIIVFVLVAFARVFALTIPGHNGTVQEAGSAKNTKYPNIAQMLCSSFDRPKIAVCLHGGARSLPHILVHTSVRENLINAIGADSTVFLHVSLGDARGDPRKDVGGTFPAVSHEDVQCAADALGVKHHHMVVLEEANATLPDCPNYKSNYDQRSDFDRRNKQEMTKKGDPRHSVDYLLSLAGQLSHREGCMSLVREEERVTHTTFDSVIMARADLTYYSSMPPYCMFAHDKPRRFWDWFYFVPRSEADGFFSEPYRRFYGCKKCMELHESVEHYFYANSAQVCPKDDHRIPIIVTRIDQNNMPQVCQSVYKGQPIFKSMYEDEVKSKDLCGPMTFQNVYNSLHGPNNV